MMQWILSKHKSMMKNAGLKTKDWNDGVKSFPIHSGASIVCADTGAAPVVLTNYNQVR